MGELCPVSSFGCRNAGIGFRRIRLNHIMYRELVVLETRMLHHKSVYKPAWGIKRMKHSKAAEDLNSQTLSPPTLNPKTLNLKTLNPNTLNPKSLNPC